MATRITRKFEELRQRGEKALIVYLTAGDPSLEQTRELVPALEKAGVDLVEIGMPFSDPTADGPIIQAASQRALAQGATLEGVLEMVAALRAVSDIPVVLFGYYNPIFVFGGEAFARAARTAGVDGLLVVDLPPEESLELRRYTDRAGIDFIRLIAPTTPAERVRRICRNAGGFLYYVSVTGVTGTRRPVAAEVARHLAELRSMTPLPLAAGFGVETPDQAAAMAASADGVVVGSAMVRLIHENRGRADLIGRATAYAHALKDALRPQSAPGLTTPVGGAHGTF